MSQILRPLTPPFKTKIARAHAPVPKRGKTLSYTQFKNCLRWEFGFTCAICLLHEVHMVLPGTGAATSHQMTTEHVVLKSTEDGKPLRDTYANCLFVCAYCNEARGDRHSHQKADGTRLLNPVDDVWSDHFRLDGYKILPLPGDADAEYTETAYDINDTVRVQRREKLADLIHRGFERVRDLGHMIVDLDQRIAAGDLKPAATEILLTERGRRHANLRKEIDALRDLAGEPWDAPGDCHCTAPRRGVPAAVKEGWQRLPAIPAAAPPVPSTRRFRV